AQRLGVPRAELEDVTDFDRRLEGECAAALRAAVALARGADVGEPRLEVAPRFDAPQMPPGAVGARDELALSQQLVGDDLAGEADRAERSRVGTERRADLFVVRRPGVC